MAHIRSYEQGVYAFERVDKWFANPPFVGNTEGLTLSARNGPTGQIVMGLTSPGYLMNVNSQPVSAVGVVFTYTGGQSGLLSSSRTLELSTGGGKSTFVSTPVSAAFLAAVIFDNHTSIQFSITAQAHPNNNTQVYRAGSTDQQATAGTTDSVGPNLRRLKNSGYI